ncbi:MAG: YoaK family protein [Ramlibacter sp.]
MFAFIRGWTDVDRTTRANVRLGAFLALVAGATNAGGFLAVGQYTSHMTGLLSAVADQLVLGQVTLAVAAAGAILAFVGGAMTTAILVNWGLRRGLASAYGLPLLLEAAALLVFGVFGASIGLFAPLFVPLTVVLLCFIMGLQNAVITKISRAEIRTTHVTGLVTDIGIELGKLLYVNPAADPRPVLANRRRLRIHATLVGSFFAGALLGAVGFKHLGFVATVPLAIGLGLLTLRPLCRDLKRRFAA